MPHAFGLHALADMFICMQTSNMCTQMHHKHAHMHANIQPVMHTCMRNSNTCTTSMHTCMRIFKCMHHKHARTHQTLMSEACMESCEACTRRMYVRAYTPVDMCRDACMSLYINVYVCMCVHTSSRLWQRNTREPTGLEVDMHACIHTYTHSHSCKTYIRGCTHTPSVRAQASRRRSGVSGVYGTRGRHTCNVRT